MGRRPSEDRRTGQPEAGELAGLTIRAERPEDEARVRAVAAEAFESAERSAPPVDATGEPGEVRLVEWLRESDAVDPDLSLVADADGEVLGHVMLSRGDLESDEAPAAGTGSTSAQESGAGEDPVAALGLGPVSVRPDVQGRGVGSALVREALVRASGFGYDLVCVLGDATWYRRFGFLPAAELGIGSPDPAWGSAFQAVRLGDTPEEGWPRLGVFRYAEPFARLEAAAARETHGTARP